MLALALLLACRGTEGDDDSEDTFRPGQETDEAPVDPDEREANQRSGAGDFALDYLRDDVYDRVVVEIDYVVGMEPSPAALERLEAVILDLGRKPGGVEIVLDDEIPSAGSPVWTFSAVDDLALAWRDRYRDAEEGTAVVHGVWLDGSSEADSDSGRILGFAYHGSSLAMFAETIADTGTGLPLLADVEDVVLAHEMGHLLGLVNNGVEMTADHQDEAHGAHDVSEDCLMYWAVETSDVVDVLLGTEPDFDAACRADVLAAGGAG